MKLLVATGNRGKLREFESLFAELPIELCGLADFPHVPEVAETGTTFAANARLKASEYARKTKMLTVADDSGLEVSVLGGAPGVFSARFAGAAATDAENTKKLLAELKRFDENERGARFICAIAVADETGGILATAEGVCSGRIADKCSGERGFGYDPLFVPDGYAQSFGELPEEIKRQVSHRARAANEIMRFLQGFLDFSLDRERNPR